MAVVSEGSSLCPCVARLGRQRPEPSLTLRRRVGAAGLRSRATGVTRVNKKSRIELRSIIAKGSFQTCNAGRAGAQPYRATRADTPTRSRDTCFSVKSRFARNSESAYSREAE